MDFFRNNIQLPAKGLFIAILMSTLLMSSLSCKRDSAQDNYERQAFGQPENFTRTDSNGNILVNDPDDWRIAPMFQGLVDIVSPAYPNPSTGQRFTIEIMISGFDAVNGLEVYTRDLRNVPFMIYQDSRRPLPPGIVDLFIEPTWLVQSRVYSEAIGLHRIFIYEGSGNLITYGDLKVE